MKKIIRDSCKTDPCKTFYWRPIAAGVTALLSVGQSAHAMDLGDPGSDWQVKWNNTISYGLGLRAEGINPYIGNSPIHAQSDYKFANAGDVVTDRTQLSSELEVTYKGTMGFRLSASGWYDPAYSGGPATNPGQLAPGVPYASNYKNNEYSSYTKRYYYLGGELQDAFVFDNFDVAGHATSVKAGRLAQYWGNSQFFSNYGVAYAQNPSDLIKASAAPATPAKDLTLPRAQLNLSSQLTPTLSVTAQYFLEYAPSQYPEGGTYLGPVDFAFKGPTQFGAEGIPNYGSVEPKNINNNFGIAARWSPEWANGTIGFYGRRLDDTNPWLLFGANANGGYYHSVYAQGSNLFGVSYDTSIAGASTGFEVSYRENAALNTASGSAAAFNATQGARGDLLNIVANTFIGLQRTPLYDTGVSIIEFAYQQKLRVTHNAAMYNGVGTTACGTSNGINSGCSTDGALSAAGPFSPQWLQVFPGVDISMPLFAMYGIRGNAAGVDAPVMKGDLTASIGFTAVVQQKYNFGIAYNYYNGPTAGLTNAAGLPNGTPGFPSYYAGGNNMYMYKDKNWVSLTFSTTF